MKILITGGLGFVGSYLAERLVRKGHEIIIVDNCLSNVVLPDFFRGQCKVVVEGIENYTPDTTFDQIYHCASIVGPAGVLPFAGTLGLEILLGTGRVVDLSMEMGARLLFISTSEVYGRDGVFHENEPKTVTHKVSVRLEYGVGKLLGELMVLNRIKTSSLIANIIRPFNIVGPRQSEKGGFVVPRFIKSALAGEDITVFGSGQQIRAFTHVLDIVEALVLVMESSFNGEVFNVGNPVNVNKIEDLAKLIKECAKSNSKIIHVDPKTIYGTLYEEAFDKIPDSSKIQKLLGWKPKYGLTEIIEETLQYTKRLAESTSAV